MNMSPVMAFEAPEDAGDDIETLWELFVLLKRVIREREREETFSRCISDNITLLNCKPSLSLSPSHQV